MTERLAPAQTYELNVLASAMGRFATPDLDPDTLYQATEMTEMAVGDFLDTDVPHVPNTLPELLEEAVGFDEKLLKQLRIGSAKEYLSESLLNTIKSIVSRHRNMCLDSLLSDNPTEQLVEPQDIADGYGLTTMWADARPTLLDEVKKYGYTTEHPTIPSFLSEKVSVEETSRLIEYVSRDILAFDGKLNVHTHFTDVDYMYHVFWTPTAKGLDYVTPSSYDRATQLSFDIPHNVAHLAHLTVIGTQEGVARYHDFMDERAFFEAVAVLSEHMILDVCRNQPERITEMAGIYNLPQNTDSVAELSKWIADDRAYEFKLRAARLHADALVIEGMPFDDIVHEISAIVGIPEKDARAETKKYLPWTGLGAVYTLGYNALLQAGITSVTQAITGKNGAVTTWGQFNAERQG